MPASLLVIDADPRKDPDCLSKLGDAIRQPLPVTLAAWSGRGDGGKHLYYLRPPGPLTGIRLPNGVDLKVDGYCIVPPSLHPDTSQPYRWENHPVVEVPPGLRELLRPPQRLKRPAPGKRTAKALVDLWPASQPMGSITL